MDFYEIFNLGFTVGGAGSYSWSPDDLKETKYRKVSDSDLEEVKLLYKRLMEIPQTNEGCPPGPTGPMDEVHGAKGSHRQGPKLKPR